MSTEEQDCIPATLVHRCYPKLWSYELKLPRYPVSKRSISLKKSGRHYSRFFCLEWTKSWLLTQHQIHKLIWSASLFCLLIILRCWPITIKFDGGSAKLCFFKMQENLKPGSWKIQNLCPQKETRTTEYYQRQVRNLCVREHPVIHHHCEKTSNQSQSFLLPCPTCREHGRKQTSWGGAIHKSSRAPGIFAVTDYQWYRTQIWNTLFLCSTIYLEH